MANHRQPLRSNTETQQGETQQTVDRMPHERDESAQSEACTQPQAQELGQMAHDDQARGMPDTSRSAETDATYHRLREQPSSDTPSPEPGDGGD